MVRDRSRKVEVDRAVYQVRAQSKGDGQVQVQAKVRGGGGALGELVAPADHLAALGRVVGEVAPGIRRAGLDGGERQVEAQGRLHALD